MTDRLTKRGVELRSTRLEISLVGSKKFCQALVEAEAEVEAEMEA